MFFQNVIHFESTIQIPCQATLQQYKQTTVPPVGHGHGHFHLVAGKSAHSACYSAHPGLSDEGTCMIRLAWF